MSAGNEFGNSGDLDGFSSERWRQVWSHREDLLKVARRRSASVQDAEDAVHEAMVRAAERTHIDGDRVGAWLTTVTVRLCVDRYRQLNREAETFLHPDFGQTGIEEAMCDQAEAKWLVDRCQELPARQAEALHLQAQNLDLSQIAQRMGLSYRAVQSLLARARRTLRAISAGALAVTVWSWRGRPRAAWSAQTVSMVSAAVTLAGAGLSLPALSETPQAPATRLETYQAPLTITPDRIPKNQETPHGPTAPRKAADAGAALVLSAQQRLGHQPAGADPASPDPGSQGPSDQPEASVPVAPPLPDAGHVAAPSLPESPPALALPDVPAQALPMSPDAALTLIEPTELDGAPAERPGSVPTADVPMLHD
ncbi:sigma-70 family RNA polymerase sigma factor [Streptomyces sp. ISL-100]|uniref:sigma-70 family RNA polymerase sigma factor n=1 Tax=Streptomyces sp. ISL-100 TaxID=2819173 RepID=UPI001BE55089|nr:sigma-70 family RNA polymerase sigma factor [Streptomyces sp. ISL-100]MBT2398745.1 sigma-70 family RNA polymerase sigma factor [Streptomyces sp. ISL-100]